MTQDNVTIDFETERLEIIAHQEELLAQKESREKHNLELVKREQRIKDEKQHRINEEKEKYQNLIDSIYETVDNTQSSKMNTHEEGIKCVNYNLEKNGIFTKRCYIRGIDLELDNEKTISIRAQSKNDEIASPLMNGTLDNMKCDYIIIITKLKSEYNHEIYIMTLNEAKKIALNRPYDKTGRDSWFIDPISYHKYRNNYSII